MPRRNGVYRTITTLKVEVLVLDVQKEKPVTEIVTVPKFYEDDLLNYLRKNIETDDKKVAHVKGIIGEDRKKYFLSLNDFIKYGEVLL